MVARFLRDIAHSDSSLHDFSSVVRKKRSGRYRPAFAKTSPSHSLNYYHIHPILDTENRPGEEAVWYDDKNPPDLDHEGSPYHQIRNSTGYILCILGGPDICNMQKVAMDILLPHFEWLGELSGELDLAETLFEAMKEIIDWARMDSREKSHR